MDAERRWRDLAPGHRVCADVGADAGLTLFPGDGTEAAGPAVLWIDACEPGQPVRADTPVAGFPPGFASVRLSLPIHWPADATRAMLHDQIHGAVTATLDLLRGQHRDQHNGRVVVAGHSFGATVALCALGHSPGLAAAVAHSGCHNRTLIPTGFQQERWSYWEVPEIYQAFSAGHFATRLREPVLIVHGAQDANPATHPDQAVHLYRAIVATGGRARLVLSPREGHNLHHRETLRDLEAEHHAFLSRLAPDRAAPGKEHGM